MHLIFSALISLLNQSYIFLFIYLFFKATGMDLNVVKYIQWSWEYL